MNFERTGEYESATENYQKEIEIRPENAAAYNGLAWLYVEKMEINFEEGIILAETAVEITKKKNLKGKNNLANYLDTLGWAYYKNGEYGNAIVYLEEALTYSDSSEIAEHLEQVRNEYEQTEANN